MSAVLRSAACLLLAVATLAASTNTFHGIIVAVTDQGFVVEQRWNSMGPRRSKKYTFRWKEMWRRPLYMVDGETLDEAGCKAVAKEGARVVICLSRGKPTILHVMTEPMLPDPQPASTPLGGTVELVLKEAVAISQWGKRGVTADTWPFKAGDLALRIDPATATVVAVLPNDFGQAPEVDTSGLTIAGTGITGKVIVTLFPAYVGEKQETRRVEFAVEATFGAEGITGTWKHGDAGGTVAGRGWAKAPVPDEALLWVLCPRGLVPGQDGKRNTVTIRLHGGKAGKEDVEILHYKGNFTVAQVGEASIELKDGVVSGTISYAVGKGAPVTVTLEGRVVGHVAAIVFTPTGGGDPLPVVNRAAGELWPVHPHAPSLMPPEKPKAKK